MSSTAAAALASNVGPRPASRHEVVRPPDTARPTRHVNHEIAALAMTIARGRVYDALPLLDRLHLHAWESQDLWLLSQTRVLRAVADIEIACLEFETSSTRRGAIATTLELLERVLPALQLVVASESDRQTTGQSLAPCHAGSSNPTRFGPEPGPMLTPRELDVLQMIAAGRSNQQIGAELFIAEGTVKKHVSRILVKLGAINRTHAVAHARRSGLL